MTGSMAEERVGAPDTTTPWRKTSMRPRCCGEKNIMTGSMAEERIGAPDTTTPWRKTSMREEAPGPVAPPCPEEEDATLDPKAIVMTGIEAEVRAEELGRGVRSGGTEAC